MAWLNSPFHPTVQGHFQIIFNPIKCPLIQWRLSAFDRLMYCSGVWAYIVGAVTTPVFIAVPLITIWCDHGWLVLVSRPCSSILHELTGCIHKLPTCLVLT